jgi:hypothetical protein
MCSVPYGPTSARSSSTKAWSRTSIPKWKAAITSASVTKSATGGGHWRLHRQYLGNAAREVAMFTDRGEPEPTVICHTSQAKERVGWQADYFSSCLLMPRQCVLDAWSNRFGSPKPIVYADIAEQNWTQRPTRRGMKPVGMILRNVIEQSFEPRA